MIFPKCPPTNVVPATNEQILYLVRHMRADEIAQFEAFFGKWDIQQAGRFFITKPEPRFALVGKDNLPVVAGGYEEVQPDIWQSWMLGTTEGWQSQWRTITKASRWYMGELIRAGARRLQTNVLSTRMDTCEWYARGLGLKLEGVHRGLGRGGQSVSDYALVAEE